MPVSSCRSHDPSQVHVKTRLHSERRASAVSGVPSSSPISAAVPQITMAPAIASRTFRPWE